MESTPCAELLKSVMSEVMPSGKKVLVAVATYNERENLPHLTEAILSVVPDADLLIIDDNSPDGTGQWAMEYACTQPRVKVLSRSGKQGLGTAVLEAMDHAIAGNYDYLVNLDADFSHPPKNIPDLLREAEYSGADVVIGSRYIAGGKIVGWPRRRHWMSRGVNRYARLVLGLRTHDNSGAFRCYSVPILKKLRRGRILSKGYSFFEEVLFRIRRLGGTFREIPIIFTERAYGQSKINGKEALTALLLLPLLPFTGLGEKH